MSDFATVEQAIEDIRNGKMVVVVDDEDRENEGDLIVAAETVTPQDINFMATYAKGLICTPIDASALMNSISARWSSTTRTTTRRHSRCPSMRTIRKRASRPLSAAIRSRSCSTEG